MEDHPVLVSVAGGLGRLTLNRPRAINALSGNMIAILSDALERWQTDPAVRAVLIEGVGEKGFCAGGDVREVRGFIVERNPQAATGFFAAEYALNLLIGTYAKPIVAIQDGICFGGGLGLSAHARFRLATERSRFAMPESAIGLFADVGISYRLGQCMPAGALAFLISGQVVGAADAIALDLCDMAVPSTDLTAIRDAIGVAVERADPGETDGAIAGVLGRQKRISGEAEFCSKAVHDLVVHDLADDPAVFITALATLPKKFPGDKTAVDFCNRLASLCPTSILATFLRFQACRGDISLKQALAADLGMAAHMAGRADFIDGVHTVLVERKPMTNWSPDRLEKVDIAALTQAMVPR